MKEISEENKLREDDLENIVNDISKILDRKEIVPISIPISKMDDDTRIDVYPLEEKCQDKIRDLSQNDMDKLKELGQMLAQSSSIEIKRVKTHPAYLALYFEARKNLESGDILKGCIKLEKAINLKKKRE